MTITIEKETEKNLDFDYEQVISRVVEAVLDFEECPYEAEVNVLLTDNAAIHEINLENRGIDRPTDVLSFPMAEYPAPGDFSRLEEDLSVFHPETGELILGDIVISLEKVKEQAEKYGHSQLRELAFLVAHSMFHLMGYDHMEEEERIQMEERQNQLMDILDIRR
ncbi:MAG: rRNA maturation RNase YbeY [Clostridiales bacterium]|nr:rRNA maturation RNase YbeY [Clostridiales bacterium]